MPILLFLSTCDSGGKHSTQGYVEAENLYLASSYSGTLQNLAVERGARVQEGDLIFQLSPNPEDLKVEEVDKVLVQEEALLEDLKLPQRKPEIGAAMAQLAQVKARLNLAKLRMKRFRLLYERKAGTLDEADAAEQHFEELKALQRQRQYQLQLAMLGARKEKIFAQEAKVKSVEAKKAFLEWQVAQKSKYAPDGGVIVDTYFVEGEWVPVGKPVAALLIPKYIWIEFFVPASVLPKLKEGQTVNLTCTGCTPSKGKIAYIAPEAEYAPPLVYSRSNNHKLVFRVRAKPIKPELFKAGQPVTVSGF